MKPTVLLDTSGLLCFLSKNEPGHATAVQMMNDPSTLLLTHNYVLAELIALAIVRGLDHLMLTDYTLRLINEVGVEVVWVDDALHQAASYLGSTEKVIVGESEKWRWTEQSG